MDIEYLLILQNFRNTINDALTPFMEAISLFAVTYLVIAVALVYWCVDKRAGLYTLASYTCGVAINATVKLTACIYRPWVRDPRVIPAGDAISTAGGYSFPSGHTATAVPIYGGFAVSAWKKLRWVSVICIVCILLTGFSRNYLGVHTPQDVIVALAVGVIVLLLMSALFRLFEKKPKAEYIFLAVGIILCIGALIFISVKQYPADYVGGKLLVDPNRMKKDGFGDIGTLLAFCVGRLIEKTWIRFKPSVTAKGFATGIVGAVIAFFMIDLLGTPMRALLGLNWGCFAENAIIVLFIVALWPAVIKVCTRAKENESWKRADEAADAE